MNLIEAARRVFLAASVVASLAIGVAPGLLAKDALPEVSPEGLQLQKTKDTRAVYLKPGATFNQYTRVAVLDCYVEFAKDWERDYNNDQSSLGRRVSSSDVDRMKAAVAAEFKKVFTDELQTKGGYQVVDTAAPDVLVLRPAIINLEVTAPDLMSADMNRTVISSAGQMTLYLELWDSVSNTILARIMDAQADRGMGGMGEFASSVGNKSAADRILKNWAEELRERLDAVHGKPAGT